MMLVQSKMKLMQSILIFYLHLNILVESKTYTLNFTRIPSVLRLRFNKAPTKSINSIQGLSQQSESGGAKPQIVLKVGGQERKTHGKYKLFWQKSAKVGGQLPPLPPW